MSEKFVVPEPSEEAVKKSESVRRADCQTESVTPAVLCAAYAVDLPRIVKQEVERALMYATMESPRRGDRGVKVDGGWITTSAAEYLAARFEESLPTVECRCTDKSVCQCFPPPMAEPNRCTSCGERLGLTTHFCGNTFEAAPTKGDVVWTGTELKVTPSSGEREHGPFCVPTDCLCPTPEGERYPTITVTPEVCGGAPCIAGTRLTTEVVAERAARESTAEVARDYGITPQQVLAAVAFERDYGAPAVMGCDRCGDVLERNEEHPGYVKPCSTCFPTPSAGEEAKPRHPYRYDCFCDACERRRRVIEGIELPVGVSAGKEGPCMFNICPTPEKCAKECQNQNPLRNKDGSLRVSAGETKHRRHDDPKPCLSPCEGCTADGCGFHPENPRWSAVGARPEGTNPPPSTTVTATCCRACKEWYIDKAKHVCRCTACGCASCTALREFGMKLAKHYASADHFFHPNHPLVAAARRVTG